MIQCDDDDGCALLHYFIVLPNLLRYPYYQGRHYKFPSHFILNHCTKFYPLNLKALIFLFSRLWFHRNQRLPKKIAPIICKIPHDQK